MLGKWWYTLQVQPGKEDRVRKDLKRQSRIEDLDQLILRILIPRQPVDVLRKGEPQIHKKKLYPGYLFCQMLLNDETFYLLRGIQHFWGFAPSGTMNPAPLSDDEVEALLRNAIQIRKKEFVPNLKDRPVQLKFGPGDQVLMKEGMFKDEVVKVKRIEGPANWPIVVVEASVLGRSVDVPVPYYRLEKT
jgi:transcriptional antiterminator NusG